MGSGYSRDSAYSFFCRMVDFLDKRTDFCRGERKEDAELASS